MAQKPLDEMADTGYANMSEESGYILHEWKQHALALMKQMEDKVEAKDYAQDMQTLSDKIDSAEDYSQAIQTLSDKIEAASTMADLSAIWRSAEVAFAPASLKKDLQDALRSLEQYETKADAVAVTSALSNQMDELRDGRMLARGSFDFSDQPLDGSFSTSLSLPAGYVLRSCWYEVIDTFTSDDTTPDSTTLKFSMESDGDLKAAVAISDAGNPFDAGFQDMLVTPSTETDNIRLTEVRSVVVEVTNGAGVTAGLTAGSMLIYAEYYKA